MLTHGHKQAPSTLTASYYYKKERLGVDINNVLVKPRVAIKS